MSETYTTALQLAYPSHGTLNWDTDIDANWARLDAQTPLQGFAVGLAEIPSATLNVKVHSGVYRKGDGTLATYAGTAGFAVTTAVANYVYLTDAGTLSASTSGWPTTGNVVRLAVVTAGATTISSIVDARVAILAVGGHSHWGVGTPTAAAGAGAGTGPTLTLSGSASDQGGTLTVLTGTGPSASAVVATLTFGMAFSAAPRAVLLTPANAAAAALTGNAQVYADVSALTTTEWTLNVGSTNLVATTTYKWSYALIG